MFNGRAKTHMTAFHRFFVLVLIMCAHFAGHSGEDPGLSVSITYSPALGGSPAHYQRHFVKLSQLPSKTRWAPASAQFPLDLESEVIRACSFLAREKQITNQIDLQSVTISRLAIPPRAIEAQGWKIE